ncbi:MAG: hypothetical protein CL678_05835 [Bdellovibrionaceae bacterium]|nr:hypothetical protein [Pseudobdellovibrionaceae bacterium]
MRPQGQPGTIADGEIFGSANRIPLIVGPLSDAIDHLTSPKNSQSSKAVEEDDVEILSDEEQDDSELTKLESLYVKAVNFNNEAVTENAKVDYSSDDKTDPVQIQKVIEALEKGIVAATEAQQFYEISENHTEEMNQTKSEIDAMKERMVVALELSKKNLENLSAVNNRNTSKKKSRGKKRKNSHSAKGSAAK